MNVAGFRERAQSALKTLFTPQKGSWSDTEFLNVLNEEHWALHAHIASLAVGAFETEDTIGETANNQTVNLPTNLYKLISLHRILGGSATADDPIEIIPIQRNVSDEAVARRLTQEGSAWYYRMRGQKSFKIYPKPTVTLADCMLVTYIYLPAQLSADTDVPFQETAGTGGAGLDNFQEWHDIILHSVVQRLLEKNKEFDKAAAYRVHKMERLSELARFLKPIASQEPRRPRYVGSPHDDLWE